MLVLTRAFGESIRINDNILVTILRLRNGKVRLGIEAPDEVPVHREEVFQRIQKRKKSE